MKVYQGIKKAVNWAGNATFALSCVLVALLTLFTAYEVLMRYVFHSPTTWTYEINGYLYIVIVLIGLGYVQGINGHIKMDFFYGRTKGKSRVILDLLIHSVILFYSIIVTYEGWIYAFKSLMKGETASSILAAPLWPSMMAVPIGFGVMALITLFQVIDGVMELAKPAEKEEAEKGKG